MMGHLIAAAGVQESHDMALISHAATLRTRVPILHFFDGFRTSHEVNKVEILTDEQNALYREITDERRAQMRERMGGRGGRGGRRPGLVREPGGVGAAPARRRRGRCRHQRSIHARP